MWWFEDNLVLLISSNNDLQLLLESVAAKCEAASCTSKSEAVVLSQKRVDYPLQVEEEMLL